MPPEKNLQYSLNKSWVGSRTCLDVFWIKQNHLAFAGIQTTVHNEQYVFCTFRIKQKMLRWEKVGRISYNLWDDNIVTVLTEGELKKNCMVLSVYIVCVIPIYETFHLQEGKGWRNTRFCVIHKLVGTLCFSLAACWSTEIPRNTHTHTHTHTHT